MGFFRHPFLFFLSLFVTDVSPVCYRSQLLSLTSNFASSSPVFTISFYLPFFALHVCRLIHKLSLCFVIHVVFKIIINFFFLKRSWRGNFLPNKRVRQRSWPCIFPPKKNLICSVRFECLISCWLTWNSVRTGGRSVGRSIGWK